MGRSYKASFLIGCWIPASDWLRGRSSINLKTPESYSGFYEIMDGQYNMDYPVWKKKIEPEVYIYYSTLR